MNNDTQIEFRYIFIHTFKSLENILDEILKEIFEVEDIQYLNNKRIFNTIYTMDCEDNTFISRVEIILFITYDEYLQIVPEFEDRLRDEEHIRVLIKVYDSYKLKQNQEFLGDLYQIEMKIREMFSVVMYKLGLSTLFPSGATPFEVKSLQELKDALANDLFFINFADYKNVNKRRTEDKYKIHRDELLKEIEFIREFGDLHKLGSFLDSSNKEIGIYDLMPELGRISDAVGRLEEFRNTIAHNRHLSKGAIENFRKAKEIVEEVYKLYTEKFRVGNI